MFDLFQYHKAHSFTGDVAIVSRTTELMVLSRFLVILGRTVQLDNIMHMALDPIFICSVCCLSVI